MKNYFPPINKKFNFLQTNRSDDLGSLWSTFNLDFQSNLGVIRLAQKLVTNTTSSDDADLGLPVAFQYFSSVWWAICNTRVFKNGDQKLTSAFTEDASSNAQTNYSSIVSDLALFNGRLWSTTSVELLSKVDDTAAWVSKDSLTTGVVHKLAYFLKFNRLYYITSPNKISSIDTADVVASTPGDYAIDLTATYGTALNQLSTIVANSSSIWIAAIRIVASNGQGTQGSIFQWDGISPQATTEYKLDTAGILAMVVHDDVPYAIDSEGRILKFTGYSFEEIGRLPINRILLSGATSGAVNRPISYNGFVATKNNTLLVLVNNLNGDVGGTVNENLASGVWEFDLSTNNFTHKYSATLKAMGSSTITDFGQNKISASGALKVNPFSHSSSADGRSTLLAGFNYFTDATTVKSGIFIDSPANPTTDMEGQKRGYLVTTWFNSQEITDKWARIWIVFRRFLNSADKIINKYRTNEEAPIEVTITWVNTTSFTTTTDVSAYAPTQSPFLEHGAVYGGEVEILQGTGSGACVHILSVVNNAGTYTVTIDNAVTGVTTGTAKARFQKWIKLLPEITGQVLQYGQMPIGDANTRIQTKTVLEFTGDDEFHKFILVSNKDLEANP